MATKAEAAGIGSELRELYFAALEAVRPHLLLPPLVSCTSDHLTISAPLGGRTWRLASDVPVTVVGAGKGAALLAASLEKLIGPRIAGGLVIVPDGYEEELTRVVVRVAGHPLPDQRGEFATRALLASLANLPVNGAVIVLVTGGASSLLVAPAAGIGRSEKTALTQSLLKSGAAIAEVNAVRKHLSSIKGGQLRRWLRGRQVLTLVVSDVIGDDPAVVGSGPTVADPTTFADAVAALRRYGLWERAPVPVREHLERGVKGEVRETPKPESASATGRSGEAELVITLATNGSAREAAVRSAASRGFVAEDMGCVLVGNTSEAARRFMREVIARVRRFSSAAAPLFIVAGGETTVQVRGTGLGGRNQEFALVAAEALSRLPGAVLLSAGSDGIDGPTDAAGAFADSTTIARAGHLGIDWQDSLARNDSYSFFSALGDLFKPGPTGVNVMDLKLLLANLRPR